MINKITSVVILKQNHKVKLEHSNPFSLEMFKQLSKKPSLISPPTGWVLLGVSEGWCLNEEKEWKTDNLSVSEYMGSEDAISLLRLSYTFVIQEIQELFPMECSSYIITVKFVNEKIISFKFGLEGTDKASEFMSVVFTHETFYRIVKEKLMSIDKTLPMDLTLEMIRVPEIAVYRDYSNKLITVAFPNHSYIDVWLKKIAVKTGKHFHVNYTKENVNYQLPVIIVIQEMQLVKYGKVVIESRCAKELPFTIDPHSGFSVMVRNLIGEFDREGENHRIALSKLAYENMLVDFTYEPATYYDALVALDKKYLDFFMSMMEHHMNEMTLEEIYNVLLTFNKYRLNADIPSTSTIAGTTGPKIASGVNIKFATIGEREILLFADRRLNRSVVSPLPTEVLYDKKFYQGTLSLGQDLFPSLFRSPTNEI